MSDKTNAARILDRMKIPYSLVEYDVDPDNLAADHVAEELGEPIEQVFKTLVLRGDKNGVFVCVVAGNREVDLKKAAKASGNEEGGNDCHEGVASPDGLYPRGMHLHRHEEEISHFS